MYWYLQKKEDRPRAILKKIQAQIDSGEFDKLKKDDRDVVIKQAVVWDQARGKNFFEPNPKSYKWFLMPHWIKGIRGGNQSGKSCTCIIDMIMQAEGWHPLQKENMERIIEETFDERVKNWLLKLWDKKIFLPSPPVKLRTVGVDYPFIERVIGQEFEKWATVEFVEEFAYTNEKKRKIQWGGGSFMEFLTYEQGISLAGAARHGIYHDEEPPQDVWNQSKMRVVNLNGRLTLGMTAERGMSWSDGEVWNPAIDKKHPTIYAIEMSTYDNPTNDQAMIDKIKQSAGDDQETIDIKIYGKSTPRGGKVYPMAKDIHPWIIDPFQIPEKDGYLIRAIDPHGKLPHAVLWIWVDYVGLHHPLFMEKPNLYEVAELFEPCNIPTLASYIKEKEMYELGRKADFELCDPYAWNTDQNNPKTLADQMHEAGLLVEPATKDRDAGIIKVKEMLSLTLGKELPEDKEKAVVLRRDFPQIMCFDNLENLREERRKYRWKQPRQKFREDVPVPQKPVDKDDHFMENEYRIALFVMEGKLELIEVKEPEFHFQGQKSPVIVNGNELDVDFSEKSNLIEDAYIG